MIWQQRASLIALVLAGLALTPHTASGLQYRHRSSWGEQQRSHIMRAASGAADDAVFTNGVLPLDTDGLQVRELVVP